MPCSLRAFFSSFSKVSYLRYIAHGSQAGVFLGIAYAAKHANVEPVVLASNDDNFSLFQESWFSRKYALTNHEKFCLYFAADKLLDFLFCRQVLVWTWKNFPRRIRKFTLLFIRMKFIRILRLKIAEVQEYFRNDARLKLHQDIGMFFILVIILLSDVLYIINTKCKLLLNCTM